MPKYVVVYFDGGELVNAGYADELPPDGGIASAGIYETGRLADGYPAYLLVPDWKYEPEQGDAITASSRINPLRIAARIASGNLSDFDQFKLSYMYEYWGASGISNTFIEGAKELLGRPVTKDEVEDLILTNPAIRNLFDELEDPNLAAAWAEQGL